ncbi:SDR family NAD(P)-dependent oxidoreductase [Candidatus Peregrinibacteria bacterium]|nr:SDR family NAD(P)-dependent oxidoreductase [Candidatus Peregrinibacteria bacterium]
MKQKKFLVTGGSGFIGSALVKRLIKDGYFVRVLDNNSRGARAKLAEVENKVDFIEADIRDSDAVKKAAKGMDSIIHLAFINGTEFFYKKPELVLDVGVRGMLSVIDACRSNGIKELILASSSEVYQTSSKIPTDEKAELSIPDVLNPRYSYAGGKIISELLTINYGRTGFDRVIIFRPHNVYGPDMGFEHVFPQFFLKAVKLIKETPNGLIKFPIQGDGNQTRAFIHIDDFTDGLMCVLEKGEHMNIYHIGNPEEITIKEVAQKVIKYFGREAEIIFGPEAHGGTQRRCPDISKLRKLGFEPKISFDKGLPSIAKWYAAYANFNK